MKKPSGGSAFPHGMHFHPTTKAVLTYAVPGMTLRDYFAASVIRGFMPNTDGTTPKIEDVVAVGYLFADAMLKEREK